jgi:hypothetical protein|tara:strand:+ start:3160 stop:3876 length:717 start_codon:yes stop_codon:yes gene_type:complete
MAPTPPRQMMPPPRTPVVGNSLQQLAAMRANRGQVPALGNVRPMQASAAPRPPIMQMGDDASEVIKEGAFNAAFETLAKKAGVNIIEGVQDVMGVKRQQEQQQQIASLQEAAMKNAAMQRLMTASSDRTVAMESGGLIALAEGGEFSGRVPGDGHGMEDNVRMPIKEGEKQVATLAVSPSEYVVDSYTMAALGNGNADEGADVMDETIKQVRKKAYGSEKQPNEIDGLAALKPLIERV